MHQQRQRYANRILQRLPARTICARSDERQETPLSTRNNKRLQKVRDVLKTSKQRGATLPYPLLELRSFTGRQKGCFIRANKQAIPT